MSKDPIVYLKHLRDAIGEVESFVLGLDLESFLKDIKTQKAVVKELEIIGEAVRQMPDDFKDKYAEVGWGMIVGMRHILIHEYFNVNWKTVWKVVQTDLPKLKERVLKILRDAGES